MRSHRFRGAFAAVALLFACYGVRMDETQIRPVAARDLDCDESLVRLESSTSDRKNVARYGARGCERSRVYACTTDAEGVVRCDNERAARPSDTPGDDHEVAAGTAIAAAGCACASLLGHRSSDPASSGGETPPNPNATTPQRSK